MVVRRYFILTVVLCMPHSLWAQETSTKEQAAPVKTDVKQVVTDPILLAPMVNKNSVTPVSPKEPLTKETPSIWTLEAPRTSILELDGYMRLRGNIHHKLDLDNETSRFISPPSNNDTFSSWDMRLRMAPVINVTEELRIATTIDVFDNLVFGSTPSYLPLKSSTAEPMAMLLNDQAEPEKNVNALVDSIVVKHLWMEADLFDDKVRLVGGRMPVHFGLGMYYNNGSCLDCDISDAADRIQLLMDFGELLVAPAYDIISSGLIRQPTNTSSGQALDLDNVDDAFELSVLIAHVDDKETLAKKRSKDEFVFNYGIMPIYRHQAREVIYDVASTYDPTNTSTLDAGEDPYYVTDGRVYAADAWLGLYTQELRLEVEAVALYSTFKTIDGSERTATQFGLAFEGRYTPKSLAKRLEVSLLGGLASGDKAPGFGTYSDWASQADPTAAEEDTTINNFQFHPSYHVDLVLFRQLLGTVTDAFYVKPALTYLFNDNIGGTIGALYGQALYKESTPSEENSPLGLEFDAEIFFRSNGVLGVEGFDYAWGRSPQKLGESLQASPVKGGLVASVAYGLLFPLKGWKNTSLAFQGEDDERDPTTMVHAILARIGLVF